MLSDVINMNLPESFINRTKDIIPQYEGFVSCLDEANVRGINVNTNKISINDFVKLFPYKISKIPYNANGFYLNEDFKIGSHPYHHAGLFYSQDPSAQAPAGQRHHRGRRRSLPHEGSDPLHQSECRPGAVTGSA